jgi:putative phosphoesterase
VRAPREPRAAHAPAHLAEVRVALLADTHGRIDPRVGEIVAGCDLAIHAGDLGGAAVMRSLQPRAGRVIAVVGNNDIPHKWPAAERDLLSLLPEVVELTLPGGKLILIHGHQIPAQGRHARLRARYPEARAVVYGHSHRLVADLDGRPWILNPGAAGRARTYGGPSCMVVTTTTQDWTLETCRFPSEPHRRDGAPTGGQD